MQPYHRTLPLNSSPLQPHQHSNLGTTSQQPRTFSPAYLQLSSSQPSHSARPRPPTYFHHGTDGFPHTNIPQQYWQSQYPIPVSTSNQSSPLNSNFHYNLPYPITRPLTSFQQEAPPGVAENLSFNKPEQNSTAEQLWFKAWLKSRNIQLDEKSKGLPNIDEARRKVLKVQSLKKELNQLFENLKKLKEVSQDEWQSNIAHFESEMLEFENAISEISNEKFKNKLKQKLSKIRRHKKWQKKHIKKLQMVRDERRRRRETLHKTIDEWRTEWIAKELAFKREQARKENAEKRVEEAEAKKTQHKELSTILEKVKKLRDLRRQRLKREGHFFPEEDDEFFNKVASLNDVMKIEEERLEKERDAAAKLKRNEAMDAGMKERDRERDPLFEYWHQAEFHLDNLVSIRRQWDAYIVPPGTQGSTRIPPGFVIPSPPANYIWASCLAQRAS
ncbi:hypothetical protein G9A89_006839 [Geosiphon pyriformis]|nr:hypothetical protein G9A89_006839 [Geosiphon pyriformis]